MIIIMIELEINLKIAYIFYLFSHSFLFYNYYTIDNVRTQYQHHRQRD